MAYNFGRPQFLKPFIPQAIDLSSAILAANNLRNIIQGLINHPIVNNVYPPRNPGGNVTQAPDKYQLKTPRWVEQKSKRVRQKYKYYGRDDQNNQDKTTWAVTERIEHMVWYDKAWKSYLIWTYGDKGDDSVPVGSPQNGGGGDTVGAS